MPTRRKFEKIKTAKSLVCLIRPPAVESFRLSTGSICLPLGLAYVASALEMAAHQVRVIDAVGEGPMVRTRYCKGYLVGLRFADIADRVPVDASMIGISVVFTHEWPAVVALVDHIKRAHPEIPVVLGGEHVTSMPEFCLVTSKADFLVLGEGEETVIELLSTLASGAPPHNVPGVACRDGAAIRVNPRRNRRIDLDSIARPEWHHFDIRAYHANRFVGGMYSEHMTVPMLATRGCPYQCTYCSAPNMWTPRWIPRDPKLVADEIEFYVRQYGARNFPFQDLTAIIKKEWILAFCQEILDRGLEITWQLPTGTRSEAIDADVAAQLRKTGMINLAYAPESGSETTRRLIKKKMKTPELFDSIDAAVANDLNVSVFLVIGFPHDEARHLSENLPFIDRLVERGITDISVGFFMALPGTELFKSLYDAGKICLDRAYFRHILDSLSLVPSQSYCEHLSKRDLALWKFKMLFRFYGVGRRARKRQSLLRSIGRGASGLYSSKGHQTKLQTAVRNGLTSLWGMAVSRMSPNWLPRADEEKMFANWDAIYQEIRGSKIEQGLVEPSPLKSADVHARNVIPLLAREHSGVHILKTGAP